MPRNYEPPYESMKAYPPNFQGVVDAIAELAVSVSGTETVPGRESTNQQLDSLNNTAESIDQQMASVVTAVNTNTSKVELMTAAVQAVESDVEEIKVDVDTLTSMQSTIVSNLNLMVPDLDNISTKINAIEFDTDTLVAISGTIRDRLPANLASPTDYLTTRLTNGTGYYSDSNALPVSIPGGISIGEVTVKNTPLPVTLSGGNVNASLTGGTVTIDSITNPVSLSGGSIVVSSITQPVSLSGGAVTVSNAITLDTAIPPNVNVVNVPHVIVDSGTLNTVQSVDTIKGGVITRLDTIAGGRITQLDTLLGGIVTRIDTLAGGRITQVDTLLGGIITRVDSITAIGFVDVTPSVPAATDYLPVRLSNASDWLGSDTLPFVDRTSINTATTITITSGNTTSSAFSISGQNSVIHLPPSSPTRTVTLQFLGWDGSTWVDALSQTTNTTLGTFMKSSDLAGAISGATGAGKNNFRLKIDSSYGSTLTFRIESRG